MLQRIENKQYQDLMFKAQYLHDQQERKFEQEMQVGGLTKLLNIYEYFVYYIMIHMYF